MCYVKEQMVGQEVRVGQGAGATYRKKNYLVPFGMVAAISFLCTVNKEERERTYRKEIVWARE